jgi:hypothetical protein
VVSSDDRFPRLTRYLARLPDGLESFPSCQAKASIYRSFLDGRASSDKDLASLPPRLASLIAFPAPPTVWVTEVESMAIFVVLADQRRLTDADALRWVRDCNRALLSGRVYRALTSLASPALLLAGTQRRWAAFHRGTELTVTRDGQEAEVVIRHPPFLFEELMVRAFGEAIHVVMELSRARAVSVELSQCYVHAARFRLRWS